MNERLKHCLCELKLHINIEELFNQKDDDEDFKNDTIDLQNQQEDLIQLLFQVNGNQQQQENQEQMELEIKAEKDKLKLLILHQVNTRSTYKSIRSPTAHLTIENAQLTFDSVIGNGGFGVVWKGTFEGNTVSFIHLGCH